MSWTGIVTGGNGFKGKIIYLTKLPLLLFYRAKLKRRIGATVFSQLKDIQVITFPVMLNENVTLSSGGYAMEKILHLIGIKPKAFTPWMQMKNILFIEWQDLTFNVFNSSEFIQKSFEYVYKDYSLDKMVKINNEANDISKKKVAKCFSICFGYDLDINPTTHTGEIVVKSDANATHDGEIIIGPIKELDIEPSKVYNIAINNLDKIGLATDYRLPYIGKPLDFCYIKKRPKGNRFSKIASAVLVKSSEIFSDTELESIDNLCKMMKIDYGELDCLRDNNTGRLYIVDIAKTPAGPPNGISNKNRYAAILEMSVAFIETFITKSHFK